MSGEKTPAVHVEAPVAAWLKAMRGRQQVRHTPILICEAAAQLGPGAALASSSF